MDFPIPELSSVYGITPRSIIKSKYFYIITAGNKYYRLYPFTQTQEEAARLFALNTLMLESGLDVCPMVLTADGSPFSLYEDELFILTRTPHGHAPDIEKARDVLKMTELTAGVHKCLRSVPVEGDAPPLPYEKGLGTLEHIKKIINRKNKLSEIDKMFMQSYAAVCARARRASEALKDCGLGCTYVYGTPKEENFILALDGRMTLTNWNTLKTSHFLADLAYIIKRYDKKNPVPQLTHGDIIKCYTSVLPLAADELTALYGILDYPEKYIAVLKEYYGKHRPFAPVYVKEKMEKELRNMGDVI